MVQHVRNLMFFPCRAIACDWSCTAHPYAICQSALAATRSAAQICPATTVTSFYCGFCTPGIFATNPLIPHCQPSPNLNCKPSPGETVATGPVPGSNLHPPWPEGPHTVVTECAGRTVAMVSETRCAHSVSVSSDNRPWGPDQHEPAPPLRPCLDMHSEPTNPA